MGTTDQENSTATLVIQLKKSPIGSPRNIRRNLMGLGLRRIHQVVHRPDTNQVRGLVNKVKHLVEVTHP